jgi:hypothetical protein
LANLIYQNPETTIWFLPTGSAQVSDVDFQVHNLASGAGYQSAHWDRGVGAIPALYEWCAFGQFATTPVVKEELKVYLKPSGASTSATAHPANDDGTGSLAVSAEDKLRNLILLGSIQVDEAAANIEMVARGFVYLHARGYNVVFWNDTADGLTNDVDENGFFLTPVPDEIQ